MSRSVVVAAIQCPLGGARAENLARVEAHVRQAASLGAQIILPPELFEGPYFCREERAEHFAEARPVEADEAVARMREVARELGVVLPVSFFERAGQAYYNSLAVVDADGSLLGVYRKSHIPDGPATRRSSTSAPAIRASACGRRSTGPSASASAGTSGSPSRRAR
jgi:N-carbamoylputrescine amidase